MTMIKKYQYKGYELQQTNYNWHYGIMDLKTKKMVLHCSCTKELNEEEMRLAIELYLSIKNNHSLFDELEEGKNNGRK